MVAKRINICYNMLNKYNHEYSFIVSKSYTIVMEAIANWNC